MVNRSVSRYFGHLGVAMLLLVLDQATKRLAYDSLAGQPPVDVLPILQWGLVFNRGAAFGFLNEAGGIQQYLFSGLAIFVSVVIVIWLWRVFMVNRLLSWGLVLVLAGALGNLVDRLQHGFVIDFINLHYHGWYFPAFNVADMAITFGAIFLIADSLGIGQKQSG